MALDDGGAVQLPRERPECLNRPVQLAEKATFFLETHNSDGVSGLAPVRVPNAWFSSDFLHMSVGDLLGDQVMICPAQVRSV